MASKKRIYVFQKTLWYQDELNYSEDGLVKEVIKDVLGGTLSEDKFGEAVDALYEKGAVPKLFAVILKPWQPIFIVKWWNQLFMPEVGIVPTMKNSEIAHVLSDFFLFNTSWIGELTSLLPGLGSKIQTMTTSSIPQNLKS